MSRTIVMVSVCLLLVLSVVPTAAQELPIGGEDPPPQGQAAVPPDGVVVFPTDALTVVDPTQATGRRITLPLPDCAVRTSDCADVTLLNTLDGFDVLPRVSVRLDAFPSGDLDALFTPDVLSIRPTSGGEPIGLGRFVYDPATRILHGEPVAQLIDATAYEVVYQGATTPFTTMSASAGLVQMRRQLDSGAAYTAAGIAAVDRGLTFTQGDLRTVFTGNDVATITRYDEVVPGGDLVSEMVIDSAIAAAGIVAFGSFRSPSWLSDTTVIEAAPTGGDGPAVQGADTVGVTLILPAGTAPDGGWPIAVFGPGITRSKYDVFLAADLNAAQGLATMSFDPVGHAFGARSEVGVQTTTSPDEVRFLGFGRGRDMNDDGIITNQEGVSAPGAPHPQAGVALRDGLRQTAADLMALVRAIQQGVDVDGDGDDDLSTDEISVYAQSLGGIYSTMFMGADTTVDTAVLNVPGGAILDIARVSPVFREVVADVLRDRVPGLLNGGINTFTEDLGLVGVDAPVTDPAAGAMAIQEVLYRTNWIGRGGSPETFAPLIAQRPVSDGAAASVLFQFALGDQTVTNPASARLARAFGDDTRVALYRNDLTATAMTNPHGFLLDPTVQGRNQGQQQVVDFLTSGGETITDPDGPLPTWEVPIVDPTILQPTNFSDDLYAAPTQAPSRDVERISGDPALTGDAADVATAVAVSRDAFDTATTVLVARVDDFADGLSGAPLAATLGGPLLLTGRDGLDEAVAAEIDRLGADTVLLLGGESALSATVGADAEATGATVERVGGTNRFDTARLVAERIGYRSEVLLVEGENADPARGFPDALSAAAIGAGLGQPILLTSADRLPQETIDALTGTVDVTVIGGTSAVSAAVVDAIRPLVSDLDRIGGANRYATSAAVADEALLRGLQPTDVWVVTGTRFADGLAAGAAAGAARGIVVLSDPSDLDGSADVRRWLGGHGASIDRARVVGGEDRLSGRVAGAVSAAIAG